MHALAGEGFGVAPRDTAQASGPGPTYKGCAEMSPRPPGSEAQVGEPWPLRGLCSVLVENGLIPPSGPGAPWGWLTLLHPGKGFAPADSAILGGLAGRGLALSCAIDSAKQREGSTSPRDSLSLWGIRFLSSVPMIGEVLIGR